jgi:isopentenyl-diphosphate Delta-isomerase
VDIFVGEARPDLALAPDPAEVEAVRWVDLYDLKAEVLRSPERFTPWLRIYLTDHMDRIFGARMMSVR